MCATVVGTGKVPLIRLLSPLNGHVFHASTLVVQYTIENFHVPRDGVIHFYNDDDLDVVANEPSGTTAQIHSFQMTGMEIGTHLITAQLRTHEGNPVGRPVVLHFEVVFSTEQLKLARLKRPSRVHLWALPHVVARRRQCHTLCFVTKAMDYGGQEKLWFELIRSLTQRKNAPFYNVQVCIRVSLSMA